MQSDNKIGNEQMNLQNNTWGNAKLKLGYLHY